MGDHAQSAESCREQMLTSPGQLTRRRRGITVNLSLVGCGPHLALYSAAIRGSVNAISHEPGLQICCAAAHTTTPSLQSASCMQPKLSA